ncbi:hypothetical protein TrLO_g7484 [Triparma laevis f. longispina]|uniref:USP domain-containing protein n=1 Tax=Triparma laevis f. longispina TaxID=1714387 RepID=A0A9W7FFW2_9STRA|nr:hypothetical protein TrLO_g7484 [Triparma laevis f. longispina]
MLSTILYPPLILVLLLPQFLSSPTPPSFPSSYPNPGNTCHLNSLLQSLRILNLKTSEPLTTSLHSTSRNDKLDSNLELLNALDLDWKVQYDVPEVLTLLISNQLLDPTPLLIPVTDVILPLDGKTTKKEKHSKVPILSLPLKRNFLKSLKAYETLETIRAQWKNSEGILTDIKKGTLLPSLPPILITSLNRFSLNPSTYEIEKKSTKCPIVESLNSGHILTSLICHKGDSTDRGHYISYVKIKNRWFECNDDLIREVKWKEVKRVGGKEGYVFFWRREEDGEL